MPKKFLNNDEYVVEGYRLFHLLRQTADAIHRSRSFELKKYGISPEQSGALVCIYSLRDKATPAELSRWLFREPNSITILLKRMHKLGLIKKKADEQRKNIIRLSLTKKGYEAYKKAIEFKAFFPIIDVLSGKKRQQLWSSLQLIREKVFESLHLDVNNYSGCLNNAIIIEPDGSNTKN
jgi:DNA-binding MarR family transcriptional regulator